jgi:hypothetical protein
MKLQQIKTWVNSLSEKELQQELLYNSNEYSISGVVAQITKAKENLYYTGEDDPAPLYTKKQLKTECGMDSEEIADLDIEIPKGSYYIDIH